MWTALAIIGGVILGAVIVLIIVAVSWFTYVTKDNHWENG